MSEEAGAPSDAFYLINFRMLANALFALCMFASVLKIDFDVGNLTDEQLIPYILDGVDEALNFIVAFLFLSLYWIKFVAQQRFITRTNNRLLLILLLYLALLCVYPFAESLIVQHPDTKLAQITFSSVWAILGFVGASGWWYACHANLVDERLTELRAHKMFVEALPEPAIALFSILCAFLSPDAYYLSLLLIIPLNYVVLRSLPRGD